MDIRGVMTYGAIAMSVLASCAFLAALAVAYLSKDQANLSILIGSVVTNFSMAISFWLGSSAGSQKKDNDVQDKPPVMIVSPPPSPSGLARE